MRPVINRAIVVVVVTVLVVVVTPTDASIGTDNNNYNVTRLFLPRRSLCQIKNNTCTTTSSSSTTTITTTPFRKCRDILQKEECQSEGWTWVYCQTPLVAQCYWETSHSYSPQQHDHSYCTSVLARSNDKDDENTCVRQGDPTTCQQNVDFRWLAPQGKECFWDNDDGRCLGDLEKKERVGFVELHDLDPAVCREPVHVQRRIGVCQDEAQIRTGQRCLAKLALDDANKGMVNNTVYYNALDMLGLSQYIYEYAALKDLAWNKRNFELLQELQTMPIDLIDVADILKNNLSLLKKNNDELDSAIATMDEYLSDIRDRNITKQTKKKGRTLRVFADTPWHVKNSMVYAILDSEDLMRVEVIFRGSSSGFDWRKNVRIAMRKEPNPVEFLNTTLPHIGLHNGFARVLLGGRNGKTAKRPMDEILEQVIPLMHNGYRLFVSGHSLGGALATLFAFYACENHDIVNFGGGPVTIFTYESPKVGDGRFRDAFKFLEERGKVRHARFHVEGDKVPQVPIGGYRHVGLEFYLHNAAPHTIDYPASKRWAQKGESAWEGLKSLPSILQNHKNEEVLRRLKWARQDLQKTSLGAEYRIMWGLQPPPNITVEGHQTSWFHNLAYNLTGPIIDGTRTFDGSD